MIISELEVELFPLLFAAFVAIIAIGQLAARNNKTW